MVVNSINSNRKPYTATWFFLNPQQTLFFQFLHSFTYHHAFKMIQFRSVILEELFLFPGASKLLPLNLLNTCSWTSFNCHLDQVISMFLLLYVCFLNWLKSSPPARPMPLQWQRHCQKMCFPLGIYLPLFPVIKAPNSLGNHVNLNESFANVLELSLSPSPSAIRQS